VGRPVATVAVAALFVAGCGGSHAGPTSTSSSGTIGSLLKGSGPSVALTQGAGSFVPGKIRFPFMVIANDARAVERPTARVIVAAGRDRQPFAKTTARLEPIGIPGRSEPASGGVTRIYVTHFEIPRPGRYWVFAQPAGARIKGVAVFEVSSKLPVPAVGAKAPRSATPTLANAPAAALTTARPPDRALLRYSIAGSLAAHRPFVVTFATPKYCTSRVCGPVVDVVEAVRRRLASMGVRFIHVEVFTDNDPAKGYNHWMRQWGLTTEPWVFLVGRDGRVKAEFEGSVSEAELNAAVRRLLL
jgi:hypothetical protein